MCGGDQRHGKQHRCSERTSSTESPEGVAAPHQLLGETVEREGPDQEPRPAGLQDERFACDCGNQGVDRLEQGGLQSPTSTPLVVGRPRPRFRTATAPPARLSSRSTSNATRSTAARMSRPSGRSRRARRVCRRCTTCGSPARNGARRPRPSATRRRSGRGHGLTLGCARVVAQHPWAMCTRGARLGSAPEREVGGMARTRRPVCCWT